MPKEGGTVANATTILGPLTEVGGGTVTVDSHGESQPPTPWQERVSVEDPGRYVEQAVLGAGGFGEVLRVYDTYMERSVALKKLHRRSPSLMSMLEVRFINEARITGKLEHPGIVPVYELGRRAADDSVYYAMRLVQGKSLLDALEGADLNGRLKLLPHFVDACQAVAYAHSRGVVHRDLKPDNIMIGAFGQTLVVDWGLAKIRGEDDLGSEALADDLAKLQGSKAATIAGSAMGTPAYMPPEQCLGDLAAIDERSDVYALGAALYHLITGQPPHSGPNARAILEATVKEPLVRPSTLVPECPPELDAIARRALRKRKEARYANAEALAADVRSFLDGGIVGAHRYTPTQWMRHALRRHWRGTLAAWLLVGAIVGTWVYRDRVGVVRAQQAARARADAEARVEAERRQVLDRELVALLDDTRRGTAQPRWLETYSFRIMRLNEPVFRNELRRRLLDALVDRSVDVRRLAARSLGGVHDADGVEPLAARLAEGAEQDPEVLVEIISALGIIADPRAEKPVAEARNRAGQNSSLWEKTRLAYRMIPLVALRPGEKLSAEHWTDRGRALADKGDPKAAEAAYDEALAMDGKFARALNNRAILLTRRDHYDEALADYDKALAVAADPTVRSKTLYNRAVLKRKKEDYEGAIEDYTAVMGHNEKMRLIALRSRSSAYRYLDQRELVRADLDEAIRLARDDPKNHYALGDFLAENGDFREAIAAFDRALAFHPLYVEARVMRGYCHRMLEQPSLALQDFAKALDIDPTADSARVNRASLLMAEGKEKEARTDLDYCLRVDCGGESWFRYAARAVVVNAAAGRWDDAERDLEQAFATSDDRSDSVLVALLGLGVSLRQLGENRASWLAKATPEPSRWWHERLLRVANGQLAPEAIAPYVPPSRRCDVILASGIALELSGDRAGAKRVYERVEHEGSPAELSCALAAALAGSLGKSERWHPP